MRKGYSLYRTWNGEDEDVIEAVEKLLARALGLTNVNLIFGMFFLGMGIYGMDFDNGYGLFEIISAASVFVGVLYMLVVNTVLQRKIINFTKEMNPEKRGSVYDTKFHKVWMESCDEMEKSQIYQAGFAAMQTTVYTCISLWVFCIFGMMLWDFGILPMVMRAVRLAGNDDQVSGCMSVRRINKKMEKVAAAADRQTSFTLPATAEVLDRRRIFVQKY